jgi:hypothetical protein
MSDEGELAIEVQKVIDARAAIWEISPDWIATETMLAIRFPRTLYRLGYAGCHLELRQIARGKLRRQFDPTSAADPDAADEEEDLFPDTLQDRYPRRRKRGEPPSYVLRVLMSRTDVEFNVRRMRRVGAALQKHADALEEWGESHLPPGETA